MTLTPAMQQYWDIKNNYKDSILFFRMWDFYEMFEDDAKIAHKILGIALTSRNKNAENPVLLAGIPFHAKEKYLPLLVSAWYKVALAEQVSSPQAKWIVEREVVRVVTPATLSLEWESYEDSSSSNIIVSLSSSWEGFWLSVVNLSDHSWKCSEFLNFADCAGELYKLSPAEVVLQKSLHWNEKIHEVLSKKFSLNIYYYESTKKPYEVLRNKLQTKNLEWFGIENKLLAQCASAQLIEYLDINQKQNLDFLHNLSYESFSGYMGLDESTIRSLDLIYNVATQSKTQGTLLWVIDSTKTPMGKRYLTRQILHPLQDIVKIKQRQKFIESLAADTILLSKLREQLKYIVDVDALLTRLSLDRAGPRDLLSLKRSLIAVREVIDIIEKSWNKTIIKIFK
jgi:DNA mismatch repair protein MutS